MARCVQRLGGKTERKVFRELCTPCLGWARRRPGAARPHKASEARMGEPRLHPMGNGEPQGSLKECMPHWISCRGN